jgi:hypothetical protein
VSNTGLAIAILTLLVITRPFETRAWQAGRISDRTLALLILGRFPILGLAAGIVGGAGLAGTVVLFGLMCIPGVVLYGWTLRRIQERGQDLDRPPSVHSR